MTTIAVLPGDGIGPEVTDAALPIIAAAGLDWTLEFGDVGWSCWQTEGNPVPERTWDLIDRTDGCLLAAITSKPMREAEAELPVELRGTGVRFVSPVIQLRQRLGLYANLRPVTDYRADTFAFEVVRENTEGLYAGFDYHGLDGELWDLVSSHPNAAASGPADTSVSLRLQTRVGIDRLLRFAFERAVVGGHSLVTLADKPNVLRQSSNFLRGRLETIAADYPDIDFEIANVDAVALWMVKSPGRFGVVVAENMFGDILSDLGAGVMGGLGLASSANIGDGGCYFEPVHGSAPGMAGAGRANPMAMILTIAQLAEHLGEDTAASRIRTAVSNVIRAGTTVTYDLGGSASTSIAAKAIIEELS
ncbi:3-isopropylmalate dehydrogenase [Rhodococcus sp. 06-412-2C]|uniref:isocitrate/isopropylmalate dehydrogenase family protein n=1 Tax=unclassified Rhodococcus (in: high G+C Gram-positive bacteria) TaxID=192944 RepID=UPI000B9A9ED7|nr:MULTISPECIES: isocitrate/isopropylmalate family dehydrogenase [unclassified Rhodococcus (in: high G+C Gram-positive bacteria)]OZC83689.1 3-isopropylmalate dehydrogenase [Rhodococcus sp. 06-412-2C]OZC93876.1 3-isopropylmalate dehydrogenase [Rhodococcus sp. 06-412-2B]